MLQAAEIIETQPIEVALDGYDVTEAQISELKQKVFDIEITDSKSYDIVRKGLSKAVSWRVAIEDRRKERNREFLKSNNGQASKMLDLISPIEENLRGKKDAVDDVKAAKKAEKARIETERVDSILKKISDVQRVIIGLNSLESGQLKDLISEYESLNISSDEYAEFQLAAKQAQAESIEIIRQALGSRIQFEEELEARNAEAERLEDQRKGQEEEKTRLDAEKLKQEIDFAHGQAILEGQKRDIDAAQKKINDEKAEIAAEKQVEIDREARATPEKSLAAEAKVQAEKDVKEKAEAESAEKKRQEALKPDMVKLDDFAEYLLDIKAPDVSSQGARDLAEKALESIYKIAGTIVYGIKEL